MKGIGYLFQVLVKAIGTKAAVAVTVTALTVTTGAVGFGGYQAVRQIEQNRQINENGFEKPLQQEKSDPQNRTQLIGETQLTEEVQPAGEIQPIGEAQPTEEVQQTGEIQSTEQDQDKNQKKAPGKTQPTGRKKTTGKAQSAQKEREQRLEKTMIALALQTKEPQAFIPVQASAGGSSVTTSDSTVTTTPVVVPDPDDPDPQPNEPRPINGNAKFIVPATLTGSTPSIAGESKIADSVPLSTKKYTVMVYICGTDLETDGSDATNDIINMLSSSYNMNEVNVLLCAGGTTAWKNQYMGSIAAYEGDDCNNDDVRLNIYQLNPCGIAESVDMSHFTGINYKNEEGLDIRRTDEEINSVINGNTLQLLGSYDSIDMGQDQLLAGFMNLCTEYYPADNYGAILWNHGGGINGGVCGSASMDGVFEGTTITIGEMESALMSSDLVKSGGKLAFMGFDACMMGSTELAYNLFPYCDYMIGSSEVTAGGWNYQAIFNEISNQAKRETEQGVEIDNRDICKKMVEYYMGTPSHYGDTETITAVACFDTKETAKAASCINQAAQKLMNMYENSNDEMKAVWYKTIKQARIKSFTTGGGVYSTTRDSNADYVDLGDFYRQLKNEFMTLKGVYQDHEDYQNREDVLQQIEQICGSIDAVLDQHFVIASGATYAGADIYQLENGTVDEAAYEYPAFWNTIRGAKLWAASLFMPYYKTAGSDAVNEYASQNVFTDYTTLVNQYNQIASSTEEKDRIERLASVINYGDVVAKNQDGISIAMNQVEVVEKTNQQTEQVPVLHLDFNDTYSEEAIALHGAGLHQNPYTDFMDTVDKITVYASRFQQTSGENEQVAGYNVVYGQQDVTYSNISNDNKSIDIIESVMSKLFGYQVFGYRYNASQDAPAIRDWARTDEAGNATTYLERLQDYSTHSSAKWITLKGRLDTIVTLAQETEDSHLDAKLHFYKDADTDQYTFAGASYWEGNDLTTKDKADLLAETMGYKLAQFYHYIIDNGTEVQLGDGGGYTNPVFTLEDPVIVYETDLMDDKKYNDYTIGFTTIEFTNEEEQKTTTQYILPSGQCQSDAISYGSNPTQIGSEMEQSGQSSGYGVQGEGGDGLIVTRVSADELTTTTTEEPETVMTSADSTASAGEPETVPTAEPTTAVPVEEFTPTNTNEPVVTSATETPTETITAEPKAEELTAEEQPSDNTPVPEPVVIEAVPQNETPVIEITPAVEPAA